MKLKPYITKPDNAERIAGWLRTRGGIAIWQSIDFSRAGQTLTTPVNTSEGVPSPKPVDWVASKPACIITDFRDLIISKDVEVKRFRVALQATDDGLLIKCTDASNRRICAAVAKVGAGAYHILDYASRETVIMKPETQVPLLDYLVSVSKATQDWRNSLAITPTETQQNETLGQPFKRLSQEGDPSVSWKLVRGSNLDPLTIFSPLPPEKSEQPPRRSDEEISDDIARILQEGERDGSIHFNPPNENYLKDVLPNETAKEGEPIAATTAPEHSEELSQVAPLSREQLRGLLNAFLGQLAASKLPAGKAPEDVLVIDPNMWASLTEEEQGKYFHELSLTKRTFILNGVRCVYDSNLGPVSWTSGGSSVPSKTIHTSNSRSASEGKRG